MSIWSWYGYNFEGESEKTFNDAFEYDYQRCNFYSDKNLLKADEILLKQILRERYKKIVYT